MICSTLCQLYCCWLRGGKEFNTRRGMFNVFKSKGSMANPWFLGEKPCRHPSMSTIQSVTIPHWLNTKEEGYHLMRLELQGSAQPSVWWGKSDGMTQLSTIPINTIKNSLNPKIDPKTKLKNPNHPTIPMPKPFLVRLSAANGKASARCWHDLDGNKLLPLWLRGKTHQ